MALGGKRDSNSEIWPPSHFKGPPFLLINDISFRPINPEFKSAFLLVHILILNKECKPKILKFGSKLSNKGPKNLQAAPENWSN